LLLLLKTQGAVYPLLETRIRELHPYDVPEIIALPIQAGSRHIWTGSRTTREHRHEGSADGPGLG
jgi:uncharacterized protein involved in tolerance to divalent cations